MAHGELFFVRDGYLIVERTLTGPRDRLFHVPLEYQLFYEDGRPVDWPGLREIRGTRTGNILVVGNPHTDVNLDEFRIANDATSESKDFVAGFQAALSDRTWHKEGQSRKYYANSQRWWDGYNEGHREKRSTVTETSNQEMNMATKRRSTTRRLHPRFREERPSSPTREAPRGAPVDQERVVAAKGIYSDMPGIAAKDYVVHYRADRKTWSVDRVGAGGTHTTIGSTRGFGTTEDVRKAIEYDAHVKGVRNATIHNEGGEAGVLKDGRVYFHPGAFANDGYEHRVGEAPRGAPADEDAATELVLYIENTSDLSPDGPRGQGHDVMLNALRKWRKGTYNPELAVKLFGYLVETGAKRYAKEMGSSEREWSTMFTPATRREAARQLEASFRNSAELGEYDHIDTRTGATSRGIASEAPHRGGYSLRQSPENASKYDAYFDGRQIGSVRGPFGSSIHGRRERTFYDWTLAGPRGHATGRAHTQTAAFNQLIAKHKEWRAIGADVSQVLPYDPSAPGPHPRVREASRDRDRPISMSYGQLPPFEKFERDIRRPDPDKSDGRPYWPEGTLYPMELVNEQEIDLAYEFGGLEEFDVVRGSPAIGPHYGFRGNERQIYDFLVFLMDQEDAYSGEEGSPGDLASSIMTTLGYEWI